MGTQHSGSPTVRVKPSHRATIQVVCTAATDDEMGEFWERFVDALDAIPGVFVQGGASERMNPSDAIAGSPLADALTGAQA